jgi:hypothetical protein
MKWIAPSCTAARGLYHVLRYWPLVVEKNIPATFKYPLRAAIGDVKMYVKMWQGRMDSEVQRCCRM